MTSISSISLTGMNAAQVQLDAAAHNVANFSTAGFHRQQVAQASQPGGGVTTSLTESPQEGERLEADLVGELVAKNQFLANLAVFKTSNRTMGALLDATS